MNKNASAVLTFLRMLAVPASVGMAAANSSRMHQVVAEAEAMNLQLRQLEAAKMQPVKDGFKGAAARADEMGRKLAQAEHAKTAQVRLLEGVTAEDLDKVAAFLGGLMAPGTRRLIGAADKAGIAAAGIPKPSPMAAAIPTPKMPAGSPKPLIGMGTKMKVLGGLGLAGAGYAGYKGLQATRDYMMVPTQQTQNWGFGGPQVKAGINQWGQAD